VPAAVGEGRSAPVAPPFGVSVMGHQRAARVGATPAAGGSAPGAVCCAGTFGPVDIAGADPVVDFQLAEAARWLQGSEARAAAGAELARLGLRDPNLVDDVLGDVTVSVLRRLRKRGALVPHDEGQSGVVAYCRRSIRNAAIDVVRGPRTRSLDQLLVDAARSADRRRQPEPAAIDDVEVEAAEEAAATTLVDGLRRSLFLSIDPRHAWRWSAALVLLALARTPDAPLQEGTPEPDPSAAEQRAAWAALHYAGRDDCFTDQDGHADPACRMRRTRAMRQVVQVLQESAAAVGAGVVQP
jgi:DNA-directed RNA polymerase specialized sigma24 family protein